MHNLTNSSGGAVDVITLTKEPLWVALTIIGVLALLFMIYLFDGADGGEGRYRKVVIIFWPCLIVEDLCLFFCSCIKYTYRTAAAIHSICVECFFRLPRPVLPSPRRGIEIPHASEVTNPTQVIIEFRNNQGPAIVVVNQIQANGIESWVNPVVAESV